MKLEGIKPLSKIPHFGDDYLDEDDSMIDSNDMVNIDTNKDINFLKNLKCLNNVDKIQNINETDDAFLIRSCRNCIEKESGIVKY